LWNFWTGIQSIPNHGLQPDGVHLTFYPNHYDDPQTLNYAFPIRNLTALEVLDVVWKAVNGN